MDNPVSWTYTRYEPAISHYKLLKVMDATTTNVDLIQKYIDAGWQPYGPPIAVGADVYQAIVGYAAVEEKKK